MSYRLAGSVAVAALVLGFATAGRGSELIYTPVNPSFGGNPFNSAHLLGIADRINQYTDPKTKDGGGGGSGGSGDSLASAFARQLQSRLLSGLSGQVVEAIFGDNPQDQGSIVFGDQTITFFRGLESIQLTITDSSTGTTTDIEVPILQLDGGG
jgi:curli production assembly/transport component CsgF